jgi:hypothetical protein
VIFANPLWWWTLVALSVPVVIHLLSRGRRQRITMGSVKHLAGAESRALRQLRMSGWPLLFLRLALLSALVVALAGPRLLRTSPSSAAGAWVLIDPDLAIADRTMGPQAAALLERLATASSEADSVRVLRPGLPEQGLESSFEGDVDAWSLLREADDKAPPGVPFVVFSFDRVELLRGRRPYLSRPVEWHVTADGETNWWIEGVSLRADERLQVTVGESSIGNTRFRTETWLVRDSPPVDSALEVDGTGRLVRLTSTDRFPADDTVYLTAPLPPLRVAISAEEGRAGDAWYVRRAMEAVGRYTGREVEWKEQSMEPVDLAIRLGKVRDIPPFATAVLRDSEPAHESCQGWAYPVEASSGRAVRLRLCSTAPDSEAGVATWVDGSGRPFLLRVPDSLTTLFELQGRFDPRWSDLVSTAALPRLLLSILDLSPVGERGVANPRSDRRAMTGAERLPHRREGSARHPPDPSDAPELLAWVILALLLITERVVSGRSA